MKTPTEFAACIAIDWADKQHVGCLQAAGSEVVESFTLEQRPEVIAEWVAGLVARFEGKPMAVCLELNKGPLVYALSVHDCLTLFPINPQSMASFREAFYPSGAKSDPTDADLQLEMLTRHRDKLTTLRPQSAAMRSLSQLVQSRRVLVDDAKRVSNRITTALKNYFPQANEWFSRKRTTLFCDFICQWPTLKKAKLARPSTLERFFKDHRYRGDERIAERIASIRSALPLTEDPGVVEPNSLLVRSLAEQLTMLEKSIRRFDNKIAEIAEQHPDYPIFRSLPRAAAAMAPRLLVAFGEDRKRYNSAAELQRYSGVAPVTEASGNQHWVHWRYGCPKYLRQTFVEWAGQSILGSLWARAYYDRQIARGKKHNAAIRALAFKWIRIIYRCWTDRTIYDESKYLAALQRRGSPLLKAIASAS